MDRRAWQATVHGVTKTRIRLSMHTHTSNNTTSNIQVMTSEQEQQGISGNLKPFSPSLETPRYLLIAAKVRQLCLLDLSQISQAGVFEGLP